METKKTKKTKEEILEQQRNAEGIPITDYIGKDGYVWRMIETAMEEYANSKIEKAIELAIDCSPYIHTEEQKRICKEITLTELEKVH